ncbi:MAG: molybdopterin-dependent oxidoreductase [Thermincola sp.]|jgi:complex iron-sulfur molybdoenzyme family reductase subunit alpha|nr:molybdopterin-dependent oxidoreductase [Thermincola sp.]MDT3701873.1 molybdopterin-dependent oxidoreductase [Thermincola sp.]
MKKYSRREFLKGLGVTSLGLPLLGIEPKLDMLQSVDDPLKAYEYRGWEELYRQMWGWDKVVRTTHSTNCTGSCGWNVQIKNGIAVRSEQSADFPDPEYNPRGCQKGASYERYVYGPQRVKYPLKRVGERGEGKWERISWDEAYDMIADKFLDIAEKDGTDHVFLFSPIPAMSMVSAGAGFRFGSLSGSVVGSFYDWYCDLPPGEPMIWGYMTETCESWDWTNSRYIILWGANAVESRIPDAHFLTEARYKGAKIVVISPDYNPTCLKADQFVPIEDGTDAALGLAMAQVIISEKLYDTAYIKEQTDLPFLVFKNTGKYLRQRDLDPAGSEEVFYRWDLGAGAAKAIVDKHSLALNGANLALEGEFQVKLASGKQAAVTTVFELLKKKLNADHRPQQAEDICKVSAQVITQLAREFAAAKPAMIIEGAGTNHWYHNDLNNRAQMLLPILTGNVGKNGGGFNHYVGQEGLKVPKMNEWFWPVKTKWQNTTLWTYYHTTGKKTRGVEKGWMPLYPEKGDSNKMMIIWRGNFLNQAKGQEAILKEIWPKQELIVDFNYRMDTTALYSDLVLPAASYFEKFDLNTTDMHEYVHSFNEAIKPLWESKPDFEIWKGLVQRITAKAKSRGMTQLADLYERWAANGDTPEKVVQWAFDNDPMTKGYTVEQVKKQPLRLKRYAGVTNDSRLGESGFKVNRMAFTPFKEHTEHREPWPTLTGRQQIYLDHDVFLEEKEQLPTYKSPVSGKYPLRYLSPHGRWSIHSTWRDLDWMLQLQRGGPIIELNPVDAKERGIADNDWVVMFNEHGESRLRAKLTYRLRPGTVMVYHGWERYTFGEGSGNWQAVTTVRVKPTQEVNYGHLKFKLNYWGPTGNNRDTLLDVKKA